MKVAPIGASESSRLSWLHAVKLLDTPPETAFDDIVELASLLCEMPIALVSLVDDKRQWFKAKVGIHISDTSRELALCAHAILEPDAIFKVPDIGADERFADNPLVTIPPGLASYFACPLRLPNGLAAGTLCVLDHRPRALTDQQLRALEILGRQVEALIELRCWRESGGLGQTGPN